jgi:hypothetical protein
MAFSKKYDENRKSFACRRKTLYCIAAYPGWLTPTPADISPRFFSALRGRMTLVIAHE